MFTAFLYKLEKQSTEIRQSSPFPLSFSLSLPLLCSLDDLCGMLTKALTFESVKSAIELINTVDEINRGWMSDKRRLLWFHKLKGLFDAALFASHSMWTRMNEWSGILSVTRTENCGFFIKQTPNICVGFDIFQVWSKAPNLTISLQIKVHMKTFHFNPSQLSDWKSHSMDLFSLHLQGNTCSLVE